MVRGLELGTYGPMALRVEASASALDLKISALTTSLAFTLTRRTFSSVRGAAGLGLTL